MSRCWLVAAMLLEAIGASTGSLGFEYLGFRSGMSLAEAEEVGLASGRAIYPLKGQPGNYSIGKGEAANGTVLICNDRLASLSINIAGAVDAFGSMTVEFLKEYGEPTTRARSGYTESGQFSDVELTWATEAGEEVTVMVASFQSRPYASISYSAFETYCR